MDKARISEWAGGRQMGGSELCLGGLAQVFNQSVTRIGVAFEREVVKLSDDCRGACGCLTGMPVLHGVQEMRHGRPNGLGRRVCRPRALAERWVGSVSAVCDGVAW